uniref:Putative cysteine rich secreted peptide n=1 Tax=Ixodes scapularis TaxID=6945 RepID=Q4PNB0_IXOSC|nr:putative cysteine rich secreted peptide [Ixodes scapularis]
MILPLSVVLCATLDCIHATHCSTTLASYMNTRCSSSNFKFVGLSECSFTCQGKNNKGQEQITRHNLADGLPCGPCKECCHGVCRPVEFGFGNPLTFKSCALQKDSS